MDAPVGQSPDDSSLEALKAWAQHREGRESDPSKPRGFLRFSKTSGHLVFMKPENMTCWERTKKLFGAGGYALKNVQKALEMALSGKKLVDAELTAAVGKFNTAVGNYNALHPLLTWRKVERLKIPREGEPLPTGSQSLVPTVAAAVASVVTPPLHLQASSVGETSTPPSKAEITGDDENEFEEMKEEFKKEDRDDYLPSVLQKKYMRSPEGEMTTRSSDEKKEATASFEAAFKDKELQLNEAVDTGDCYYDSVAQALVAIGIRDTLTAGDVRKEVADYAAAIDAKHNKSNQNCVWKAFCHIEGGIPTPPDPLPESLEEYKNQYGSSDLPLDAFGEPIDDEEAYQSYKTIEEQSNQDSYQEQLTLFNETVDRSYREYCEQVGICHADLENENERAYNEWYQKSGEEYNRIVGEMCQLFDQIAGVVENYSKCPTEEGKWKELKQQNNHYKELKRSLEIIGPPKRKIPIWGDCEIDNEIIREIYGVDVVPYQYDKAAHVGKPPGRSAEVFAEGVRKWKTWVDETNPRRTIALAYDRNHFRPLLPKKQDKKN